MACWEECLTIAASVWAPEWVAELRIARNGTRAEIARRSVDNGSRES